MGEVAVTDQARWQSREQGLGTGGALARINRPEHPLTYTCVVCPDVPLADYRHGIWYMHIANMVTS
jgi:hypothetical protein